MAKHAGAYRGDKRRKELARQKKQEEKRQRRFSREKPSETSDIEDIATDDKKLPHEKAGQ